MAIIYVLIVILLLVFAVFKYKLYRMTPLPTGYVKDNVYAIIDSSYINMFLIKGDSGYIAVDCGKNPVNIKKGLDRLNISPDEIKYVLLTHTDSDHIGALSLFSKAKIFISKDEEKMIDGSTVRSFLFMKNKLPFAYEMIKDEETFEILGISIKGILTKGHTLGSMCYIINEKTLFTGDILSIRNDKITNEINLFHMNVADNKESIKKLSKLKNIENLFTAHYGYSQNFEKLF